MLSHFRDSAVKQVVGAVILLLEGFGAWQMTQQARKYS
jgi:hypothetical protein